MVLAVGSTFGRYRIERELGAGGMGQVYAAQDTLLRRPVALKIVRTQDVEDEMLAKEGAARLLREARSAAALRHPNAVAIFDIGEIESIAFIAMELVTGQTLSSKTKHGAGGATTAHKIGWLLGVARALAAAHREGIIHRDVKPDNVMVCTDGSIKVLDFGIAKRHFADGEAEAAAKKMVHAEDGPPSFKTAEGVVSGTPRYMSPEQLIGGRVGVASDQFSWAVLAYELLSGGVHPQSTTGTAQRWGAPPALLSSIAPTVPTPVAEAVMRALERWPEHRWPSMDAIVEALEPHANVVFTNNPVAGGRALPLVGDAAQKDQKEPSPGEPTLRFPSPTERRAREEEEEDAREVLREKEKKAKAKAEAATANATPIAIADASTVPDKQARVLVGEKTTDEAAIERVAGLTGVSPFTAAFDARVIDLHRPTWRRLALPAIGLASIFFGFTDMIVEVVAFGASSTPALGEWLIRSGWLTLLIAPLTKLLGRDARPARIDTTSTGRVSIRGARGMSQSISASEIVGASLAPMNSGTASHDPNASFSVLLMTKRLGARPIAIDVAREEQGHAILAALGITHANALTGILSWPLRRGGFDLFRFIIAITWRVTIVTSNLGIPILSPLCVALSLLTGLLAGGLAFAPSSGPHIELTPDQLRIFGSNANSGSGASPRTLALRDVLSASGTDKEILFRLRSGDTFAVAAPKTWTFGMRSVEREHLVDHLNAAAERAHVAWS